MAALIRHDGILRSFCSRRFHDFSDSLSRAKSLAHDQKERPGKKLASHREGNEAIVGSVEKFPQEGAPKEPGDSVPRVKDPVCCSTLAGRDHAGDRRLENRLC
jgi:hypothetical protein